MIEDIALLRAYVEERSETAFAELVERRAGLVYAIALRQVGGDSHLAWDATQKVFVALARQSSTLLQRPAIAGWLYRTAHHIAIDLMRTERARRTREQRSELMPETTPDPGASADWTALRPLLGDAMSALNDSDRDAVALRYFEGRSFSDIGRALRLTEDAARKRVDRALDKLAGILRGRGVTSTSAALAAILTEQAAAAAPAGLASASTGVALASATVAAGTGTLAWLGSAKATLATAAVAAVAIGVAFQQNGRADAAAARFASVNGENLAMRAKLATIERTSLATEQRALAAEDDNARLLAAIESAKASRTASLVTIQKIQPPPPSSAEAAKDDSATAEPRIHLRVIQLSRTNNATDAQLAAQANMILDRFSRGESFADLAREFSTDARKSRGGDWGWVKPSDIKDATRSVVSNLNKGQASVALLMPEGCFILYAEDRK